MRLHKDSPKDVLTIDVFYDLGPSAGEDPCIVRPNTAVIPRGTYRIVWNLTTVGPEADSRPAKIHQVTFEDPALSIRRNQSVSSTQWQAEIDNPGGEFRPLPYHFAVEHEGEITDCYPHCVGSPDGSG